MLLARLAEGVPRGVPLGVTRLSPKKRAWLLGPRRGAGRSSGPPAPVARPLAVEPGEERLLVTTVIPGSSIGIERIELTPPSVICDAAVAATLLLLLKALVGEFLGEGRTLAEGGTCVINYVDCDDKNESDTEENGGGVFEILSGGRPDILEEWGRRDGENAGEEVSGPTVAAGGRGGIGTVLMNFHVSTRSNACGKLGKKKGKEKKNGGKNPQAQIM